MKLPVVLVSFFVTPTHILTVALKLALIIYQISTIIHISANQSHNLPIFDHHHSNTNQSHKIRNYSTILKLKKYKLSNTQNLLTKTKTKSDQFRPRVLRDI